VTERELREIKRRFRPERSNIPKIVGCFVNSGGQIVSKISQSLGLSDPAVSEKLLGVMKKTLSGSIGTNLTELAFSTKEVSEGEEHKLLMKLKESRLEDKEALDKFYAKAIEGIKIEGNYVILLASDVYDVPHKSLDGESEDSYTQFSYMICAVCPLKNPPEALAFRESESLFRYSDAAALLSSPEIGFMFPAFDDRAANIYNLLFYSKSLEAKNEEFLEKVFKKEAPLPPKAQKAAFADCLTETLSEECSFGVIKTVQATIEEMVDSHKESRDPEPLLITKSSAKDILRGCGIDEEKVEKFGEAMDESFGKNAALPPKNISAKKFELSTPEVKIKVDPEYKDLVSTQTINGSKYIMIKVTSGVELNGISLSFEE